MTLQVSSLISEMTVPMQRSELPDLSTIVQVR